MIRLNKHKQAHLWGRVGFELLQKQRSSPCPHGRCKILHLKAHLATHIWDYQCKSYQIGLLHSAACRKLWIWRNDSCNYNLCIITQWNAVEIWLKPGIIQVKKVALTGGRPCLSYLDHLAGPHVSSVALSQEKNEPRLLCACCATHWRTLKSCFSMWRSDAIVSESRTRRSSHSSVPVAALAPRSTRTHFQRCFWTLCSLKTCCCDTRSDERETWLAGWLALHAWTRLGRTGRVSDFQEIFQPPGRREVEVLMADPLVSRNAAHKDCGGTHRGQVCCQTALCDSEVYQLHSLVWSQTVPCQQIVCLYPKGCPLVLRHR